MSELPRVQPRAISDHEELAQAWLKVLHLSKCLKGLTNRLTQQRGNTMSHTIIDEDEAERMFDEILDEAGTVSVAGLTFYPSKILSECDPIAYGIYLGDYIDGLTEDGIYVEGVTDNEMPEDEEIE